MTFKNLRHNGWLWVCLFFLALGILYYVPVDVSYDIPVTGRVFPAREWRLVQSDGEFHTEENSFLKESSSGQRTFVFERGDVVDIKYNNEVHNDSFIKKDTEILSFSSLMHRLDVQRAQNEQDIQRSQYRADAAPNRRPDLEASIERLELARANVTLQQANFDRLSNLYAEEVISKFELDQQTNALQVAQKAEQVAAKELSALKFGVKPEDLAVLNTRIETVDSELDILKGRNDSYTVSAPFSGLIAMSPGEGVVIEITDTSKAVLQFPVAVSQLLFVNENARLVFDSQDEEHADFEIARQAEWLNGQQVSFGSIQLDGKDFPIGQFVNGEIRCDKVRLGEYIKRKLL